MSEKLMRERLKRTCLCMAAVVVVLIAVGGLVAVYLQNTLINETISQMRVETGELVNRLDKQISDDFQLLNTVEKIIETGEIESSDSFLQILRESCDANDFNVMMYFDSNRLGMVTMVAEGQEETSVPLSHIHEECQEVIEQAFLGERSLSRAIDCDLAGTWEFAYGVPVYRDGKIVGALAGIKNVESYVKILDVYGVLGGKGYVHLMDSDGNFIIFSNHSVLNYKLNSLYEGAYFEESEFESVEQRLKSKQDIEFTFDHEGRGYRALLHPAGHNDWYLLCISTYEDQGNVVYNMVLMILYIFTVILVLIILLMLYGTYYFGKNYRGLLDIAYYDEVSKLYNRAGFLQKIDEVKKNTMNFSLVGVNLHQFKYVNEVFGKKRADGLLSLIGEIIRSKLEEGEFACRNAADVFYMFLKESDRERLSSRLSSLLDEIEATAVQFGKNFQLRTYCGCVTADWSGGDVDISRMLTHLVFTLSQAKKSTDGRICFYDGGLFEKLQIENYVEGHMKKALERGEFKMFLRPKIDLKDGMLCGAEALVRWIPENGNPIYPDQFIPIFEKNGFCTQLDMYMVDSACRQIRAWMNQGIEPIGISVNQTRLLFYNPDYVEMLQKIVQAYSVPAELITLEILEGTFTDDPTALENKILELKAAGFRVSMDDFGSGYSSLNILSKLHIDELKIDREFLRELTADDERRTEVVLEQVVHMTKKLDITTVVEGVETDEQEVLVKGLSIDFGQGYYYSRPINKDEFHEKYMVKRAAAK